jgi:Uma2 family endonuclease
MTPLSANRRTLPEFSTPQLVDPGVCLRIPRSAFSINGFREWVLSDEFPEKLKVTFVDGEIYLDTSKEELQAHAFVKAEIARVLLNLNRENNLGRFCLDGVLVSNQKAEVSNSPDAVFMTWESLEGGRVRLVEGKTKQGQLMEIEGSPDWVLEIMSDSSVKKDKKKLRLAYWRAGILEYWLVDAREPQISFQILHWRKKGYGADQAKGGWQRSRVFQQHFRLSRAMSRMGLWEYTLESKRD